MPQWLLHLLRGRFCNPYMFTNDRYVHFPWVVIVAYLSCISGATLASTPLTNLLSANVEATLSCCKTRIHSPPVVSIAASFSKPNRDEQNNFNIAVASFAGSFAYFRFDVNPPLFDLPKSDEISSPVNWVAFAA